MGEIVNHGRSIAKLGRVEFGQDALVYGARFQGWRPAGAPIGGRLPFLDQLRPHGGQLVDLAPAALECLAHLVDFGLTRRLVHIKRVDLVAQRLHGAQSLLLVALGYLQRALAAGPHGAILLRHGVGGRGVVDVCGELVGLIRFGNVVAKALQPFLDGLKTRLGNTQHAASIAEQRLRPHERRLAPVEGGLILRDPVGELRSYSLHARQRRVILLDRRILLVELVVFGEGPNRDEVLVELAIAFLVDLAVTKGLLDGGLEARADDLAGLEIGDALLQPLAATTVRAREHAQPLVEVVGDLDRDRAAVRIADAVGVGRIEQIAHAARRRMKAIDDRLVGRRQLAGHVVERLVGRQILPRRRVVLRRDAGGDLIQRRRRDVALVFVLDGGEPLEHVGALCVQKLFHVGGEPRSLLLGRLRVEDVALEPSGPAFRKLGRHGAGLAGQSLFVLLLDGTQVCSECRFEVVPTLVGQNLDVS